ncbi:MAG: hypothetical protein ACRDZR_18135, partial [Acidimicrobiales bacterium]
AGHLSPAAGASLTARRRPRHAPRPAEVAAGDGATPDRPTPPRAARAARLAARHALTVAVLALPAVVLWWHAWDGHLTSTVTCTCGDAGQEVWFVAWPAYALAHGLDPLFSGWLYAPRGVNLMANTGTPLVGTVLAPVTWLFGPVAATTVALTLSPALSAWGCLVACRHVTRWRAAAWVAALLFGYSPFVVTNLADGHVMVSLLVVPPLLLLAGHEILVARRGDPVRWGVAAGVLAAVQFLISPEVLAITAVAGAAGLLLLVALAPRLVAGSLRRAARAGAAAVVVGGALVALPAWFLLAGPRHISGPPWTGLAVLIEGTQPYTVWDPGAYRSAAGMLSRLSGYEGASGPPAAYLGWGVLALAAASLVVAWRRRAAWWAAGTAVVVFVLSLGTLLWTSPDHLSTLWLPWKVVGRLPLLADVLPARLSGLADLFVAVLVAVGLDAARRRLGACVRPGPARAGGVVLVAAALVAVGTVWWTYQVPFTTRQVAVPRWFATAGTTVAPGSVVLALPFPFPSTGTSGPMVWQAEDGMRFRLAGGYAKAPGPGGRPLSDHPDRPPYGTLTRLSTRFLGPPPAGTPHQLAGLRAALRRWQVDDVVVTGRIPDPARAATLLTGVVGRAPARSHGAWVWDLRRRPAARG